MNQIKTKASKRTKPRKKRPPFHQKEIQAELIGRKEIQIDGCGGIIEYDGQQVCLSAGNQQIRVWGQELEISLMTHNGIIIRGLITGVEYYS